MKKLILSLLAALVIFSGCTKQFKVTLNLNNADQKNVYLCKMVDGKNVTIDSDVFSGNKTELKADFDDPQTAYFIKFDETTDCGIFPFFTENQNTTITGDIDSMQLWSVKGCPIMDEWTAYRESLLPMENEMFAVYEASMEAYMAGDTTKASEFFGQVETMMDEYNNFRLNYIRNHPDSYLAHFMLDQEKESFEFEDVKTIANSFITESIYSKNIKEYIKNSERLDIGQPFIDFNLKTVDGKNVNLAETIKNNKVTLIDFWASWCGPCRGENPNVKAAYEKYHEKGLEIIGISCDKDEAAWLKAVEEDALPWTHVRDIDHTASNDYQVIYIPSNFLFDQNGVIIAKNLRGADLEAKLAEVLK